MGKTTLLAELARSAEGMGVTVLYGTSDETGVSLEPFRTILGACVEHADIDLLSEHVARCGGELARLCPRLVGSSTDRSPADRVGRRDRSDSSPSKR